MLLTRNIFLDTSIVVGLNFNYAHPTIKRLLDLIQQERAHLLTTSITVAEVEANIRKQVHASSQAHAKFGKDAKILRNLEESEYRALFAPFTTGKAEECLIVQHKAFLEAAKAEVLVPPANCVETVFSQYFGNAPPFGDGKKKSEFPDAFAMAALDEWCERNNQRVYVVSHDTDIKTYCEGNPRLIWLEHPRDFLGLLLLHDEKLAPLVNRLVESHPADLERAVATEFANIGFWLDDLEGEVYDVTVEQVEIEDHSLIEVTPESAVVEVSAKVSFSAEVEYDDLETATYDSEDKVLIPWRKISTTLERSEDISATLHLAINVDAPDFFKIGHTEINTGKDWGIAITAVDDGYPYK